MHESLLQHEKLVADGTLSNSIQRPEAAMQRELCLAKIPLVYPEKNSFGKGWSERNNIQARDEMEMSQVGRGYAIAQFQCRNTNQ